MEEATSQDGAYYLTSFLDVDRIAQELSGPDPCDMVSVVVAGDIDVFIRSKHLRSIVVETVGT